jgi:hypothetical protein
MSTDRTQYFANTLRFGLCGGRIRGRAPIEVNIFRKGVQNFQQHHDLSALDASFAWVADS